MALCACGCGGVAPVNPRNNVREGYVKGESYRYIQGHHWRHRARLGYRRIMENGILRKAHRVRAEKALGKPLPPKAVVHHADGSKDENAPLVICQDQAYHRLLHARMRVVRAGGNPNTEKICGACKAVLPFAAFNKDVQTPSGLCNRCIPCIRAIKNRAYRLRRGIRLTAPTGSESGSTFPTGRP